MWLIKAWASPSLKWGEPGRMEDLALLHLTSATSMPRTGSAGRTSRGERGTSSSFAALEVG